MLSRAREAPLPLRARRPDTARLRPDVGETARTRTPHADQDLAARRRREQAGMAVIVVLVMILTLVAVGAFIILAVDRNAELGGTYQKSVAGFQAAEAGINIGAAAVLNKMQANQVPSGSDCNPQMTTIEGRTVTYTLSGCGQTPAWAPLAADDPFAGLNANVYTYTLTSTAVNSVGFTESSLRMQFYAREIPMFQFAGFFQGDLEYAPARPTWVNGRLHTNGDMYLNTVNCGTTPSGGLNILGQITIVGSGLPGMAPLTHGRKDQTTNQNSGHVYISLDGTNNPSSMQILGTDAQGSTNCGPVNNRQIPQSEINTWNGRIRTGLKNVTLPYTNDLYCAPWSCATGQSPAPGGYWQNADLRIVLDQTATPQQLVSGTGPSLYPVKVVDSAGNLDSARTSQLETFMTTVPGAITYSDVPTGAQWNCMQHSTCESNTYSSRTGYSPAFPNAHAPACGGGSFPGRTPRAVITSASYCYDYRYGGFYNWRERKPILMLNIDWMALEEWNRNHSNALFNPAGTTNNGLVIFASVHGQYSRGANDYGVRIYDAARARYGSADLGITFATDGAMYVLGNFNCPAPNTSGGPSVPPTCGASGSQKPASIVGDSVNVLSCAWAQPIGAQPALCGSFSMDTTQWVAGYRPTDEHGTTATWSATSPHAPGSTGGNPAADTIWNAALLAGTDKTWCPGNSTGYNCGSTNWYGGGLENYPRFHEDWTSGSNNFWYQGSFVSVGYPQHTCFAYITQLTSTADDGAYTCTSYPEQGFWMYQDYYPPNRHWFYDVSFNNPANWPPLAPHVTSLKQVLFTEPFQ